MEPSLNKKVLLIEIVEDESAQRKALVDKFAGQGFHVLEAKDGVEGLNVAMSQKPDIILLDIMMPRMNGLEMLKRLRESGDWGKKVPVIILTNLSPDDEEVNQKIAESEPSYYLTKSGSTIDEIVEKVKEQFS